MLVNNFIEIKSLAIVILGDFNPAIIQPFWLAKKELIRESEATQAKVNLIHNELVMFDLGWAKFEVKPDRFEISTPSEPYFRPLIDLLSGIFTYLPETPTTAVGINYIYDLNLKTPERYYNFGDKFVPLINWDFLNEARVINLDILEKDRKDNIPGHYRIRVESSNRLSTFGVNIVLTDHMEVKTEKAGKENAILQLIGKHWKHSSELADKNIQAIWDKFNN